MPPAEPRRGGSTRRTPAWLIALAAVLLALRVGLGIYEAQAGRLQPPESPMIQIHP